MIKRLKTIFKQDNLEYEFLPPALEIEETPASPLHRVLIWVIFIITLSTFAWSYLGRVDVVAVARGKVIPDGRIKIIQPIETGVIRTLHVKEGQRIKAGQILIELDPTIKEADVTSSVKALSIYQIDKKMLMEELSGTDAEEALSEGHLKNVAARKSLRDTAGIRQLQTRLKEVRESEYKAKEDALTLIIAQRENALHAAGAMLTRLEKTYVILKEQENAFRDLYGRDYIPKMDLLDKQRELYSTEQELEAQKRVVGQVKDSLEEARKNLDAFKKERVKGIIGDIVEREKTISAMEGEVIKAKKRYELEQLCSPVDGTVHGISSYTIGGVVTPAQPIVTIVPAGTPLIVEAMALNKDIGFLKVGQEAEVKLDTFPFQKYGTIKGRVSSISPDAFEDEKLGSVYKIRVELEKLSLMVDGRNVPVSPGMTVAVEVKTGKRRIIEFFLSPIVKYAKESLTLR
ncbi:MAG: HlyD family type I secretion periplasmic adaptor subunit [Thermodesulfobacteriota bacterium]|nr:HlyD family type I secretion periplasmic adaptor subunit [Thermodesulfobacteriota bacterium]